MFTAVDARDPCAGRSGGVERPCPALRLLLAEQVAFVYPRRMHAPGIGAIAILLVSACAAEEHARPAAGAPEVSTAADTPGAAASADTPGASVSADTPAPAAPPGNAAPWGPPECRSTRSYYMVDCDPQSDPSCGPERMRPVSCPPR